MNTVESVIIKYLMSFARTFDRSSQVGLLIFVLELGTLLQESAAYREIHQVICLGGTSGDFHTFDVYWKN